VQPLIDLLAGDEQALLVLPGKRKAGEYLDHLANLRRGSRWWLLRSF